MPGLIFKYRARIDQSVANRIWEQEVAGSIPGSASNLSEDLW